MLIQPISLTGDVARALDPTLLSIDCGIMPDPWQAELLCSTSLRRLVLCSRQSGKSTTCALLALHHAIYIPNALVIIISPSLDQSIELFRKIADFRNKLLGAPECIEESMSRMTLANGSRIVSLPGSERTIRGYSGVTLVIFDEAAFIANDELISSVSPMLATTNGTFIALSTANAKQGWFYEKWTSTEDWERFTITATECPRISAEFLEAEKANIGLMRFNREYMCEFADPMAAVFSTDLIEAALTDDFEPFH